MKYNNIPALISICFMIWFFLSFNRAAAWADDPILVIDSFGHSGIIQDVMFTPDGSKLISISLDKTIRIWDVKTGDLVRTLRIPIGKGIQGMIHTGALSPDGRLLAVAGWTSNEDNDEGIPIYIIALEKNEILATFTGHEDVIVALDFSQDGKWLASGGDTSVRLWDLNQMKHVLTLKNGDQGVTDVAISSDGYTIASADYDGTFRIWNLSKTHDSVQKEYKNKLHENSIEALAFAPNDQYLATAGGDYQIIIWNTKASPVKKIEALPYPGTLLFSPDSKKILLAGTEDAPAIVYDIKTGKKLISFDKHTNTVVASAFFKNGLIATAGGNDKDIYLWDVKTGKAKTHISGKGKAVWSIGFGKGLNIAFGNTNISSGKINRGAKDFTQFSDYPELFPFDISFNLETMVLDRTKPVEKLYDRSITRFKNHTINRISWEKLEVFKGKPIANTGYGARWIRAYSFTKTGDVVTGFESWIRAYKNNGELLWEKSEHMGQTWAFAASYDGTIIASASDDQTIKLWNVKTGECLASLFVSTDFEWICWTPQGFYTASAGGEKYIGWHLNQGFRKMAKFYPVSTFRKRFHHPELVKQTIAMGSFEAAFKKINAKTRKPIKHTKIANVLPPKIKWVSPREIETTTQNSSFDIQARIIPSDNIKDLKILVNGRVRESDRGMSIMKSGEKNIIDKTISLAPGINEIRIYTANEDTSVTSESRTVHYQKRRDDWEKPNLYMIAVGISKYEDQNLNLNFADDDAKSMSELFRSQKGALYQNITIKELYDTEATRDNILDALEWLEEETTQKDVAVIFMAAHGMNDDRGRFYLLPSDGNPQKLRRSAVDWGEFIDILGNLPSRVLFFLDTCHSGQLGKNLAENNQTMTRGTIDNTEAIRDLASDENGVVILAASTGKEYSLEHPDWGHGAFTKALLDGLGDGHADYSKDGIIHLRELDTYIAEQVKKITQGRQHPTTLKPSTISRLPIVQLEK